MTREDIIRMAREAGIEHLENVEEMRSPMSDGVWLEDLEHFATLVAAASEAKEREACAKVCYELGAKDDSFYAEFSRSEDCAEAIRARGQA